MSESMALLRLSLLRHQTLAGAALFAVIATQTILWVAKVSSRDAAWTDYALIAATLTLLLAGLMSIVLFDYGPSQDLGSPASGYPHWLLRMPIASWKFAIVPAGLKTVWVTCLWGLLVLDFGWIDGKSLPLLTGVGLAAASILVSVVVWRPVRSPWLRIPPLIAAVALLYAAIGSGVMQYEWPGLPALVRTLALAANVAAYLIVLSLAVGSIHVARTDPTGVVASKVGRSGARATQVRPAPAAPPDFPRRHFSSAPAALIWHDVARMSPTLTWFFLGVLLPMAILAPLLTLVKPIVIAAVFGVCLMTCPVVIQLLESESSRSTPSLPPYLAVSPLTSAQIAWSRLLAGTALALLVALVTCLLLTLGFAAWESNRAAWMLWSQQQQSPLDETAGSVLIVGFRWTIAMLLAVIVTAVAFSIGNLWPAMTGRNWVTIAWSTAGIVAMVSVIVLGLGWFLRQRDWESVLTTFRTVGSYAPRLLILLLALKGLAIMGAVAGLWSSRLASAPAIVLLGVIWLATSLIVAGLLSALIPDPRLTFAGSLGLTVLVIPLARLYVLPLAVAWNRHR